MLSKCALVLRVSFLSGGWSKFYSMSQKIRIKEAAKLLGVVPTTVQTWCRDGRLEQNYHFTKTTKGYIFDLAALVEFVERNLTVR